jgi:hypothetical protein
MARRYDRLYREARAAYAPRLPRIDRVSAGIVAKLNEEGICSVPLSALVGDGCTALLEAARLLEGEQAGFFASAHAAGHDFLIAPATAVHRRPALFRFGLHDRLLDIVEAYVGLPIAYDGVVLQHTPADGRVAATRAWHRDREDRTVIKVAVYLDAVGPEDGPFELLPDPNTAEPEVGTTSIACTGPAGTVVFADTARFLHRGRPITGQRPRTALFFSYFARRPRDPWFCARTGTTSRQLRALTAGLSSRQRDAALWRRGLPLLARLVPPAPL